MGRVAPLELDFANNRDCAREAAELASRVALPRAVSGPEDDEYN